MKIRCFSLIAVFAISSAAFASEGTATLSCKLNKLNPASLADKTAPVTVGPDHAFRLDFSSALASIPKKRKKGGGFSITPDSVRVTDPDGIFLGAKVMSAGMTSDREMMFFHARNSAGDELFVPVPKSSKEPEIWNGAVSLQGNRPENEKRNHIFMGKCSLAGLDPATLQIGSVK